MSLTPGTRLGQYELLEQLGTGGMGAVYKAHDPTLQRTVAIKVLAKQDADASARLLQEARAASALNHPHICSVYEVGEHEGQAFIVMEHVEGKALSQLIPSDGLPPESVIRYATQIADALAHAHERGIVHRDLKSQNVVITPEGRAKVLDFGLAARMPQADAEAVTQTQEALPHAGMLVGTLAYMAPEVLRGEQATARSDIWALGVLLYEMASGRLPFGGPTVTAIVSAVATDSPASLPAKAWAGLRTIAQRCLAKEPGQRYGHASAVQAALEAIQSGTAAAQPEREDRPSREEVSRKGPAERTSDSVPWIAVLPFRLRGSGAGLQGLAEGLTEDIVTGLSQFSYLSVLGANTTRQYHEQTTDVRTVGRELGARYAIEGSIQDAGTSLRVSAQLQDTTSGTNLWAERFDRTLGDTDIFALQDELTDRIVATVADMYGVLVRAMGELARAKPAEALTANECVSLFFAYWQTVRPDDRLRVRKVLERYVAREPRHADVWACLSLVQMDEYRLDSDPRPGALDRALDAARRAVEVDSTSPLASHALAAVYFFRRELGAFRAAADRAVTLNPRDSVTVAHMGVLLGYAGDWDAGLPLVRKAMALNSHHAPFYHYGPFWDYYCRHEYDLALTTLQKINYPGYFWTPISLAITNAQLGRREAAREALREALNMVPDLAEKARPESSKWF